MSVNERQVDHIASMLTDDPDVVRESTPLPNNPYTKDYASRIRYQQQDQAPSDPTQQKAELDAAWQEFGDGMQKIEKYLELRGLYSVYQKFLQDLSAARVMYHG